LQGANLTAWEMSERLIPYTVFVDAASGLLLQRGDVDVVFVGADRVARNGDVCNKIGTYDKALAARDNRVPFYVALPSPTIDWQLASGDSIPIESRSADEVLTTARAMNASGINRGAAGNVSARIDGGFLITPSGVPYDLTTPDDIVAVNDDGQPRGRLAPSSEWRFHREIYRDRPELHAIVH